MRPRKEDTLSLRTIPGWHTLLYPPLQTRAVQTQGSGLCYFRAGPPAPKPIPSFKWRLAPMPAEDHVLKEREMPGGASPAHRESGRILHIHALSTPAQKHTPGEQWKGLLFSTSTSFWLRSSFGQPRHLRLPGVGGGSQHLPNQRHPCQHEQLRGRLGWEA